MNISTGNSGMNVDKRSPIPLYLKKNKGKNGGLCPFFLLPSKALTALAGRGYG
jgi:hypothetical protein